MPRPVTLLSVLILGGAGAALVDAQDPYALPETPVSPSSFRLPSTAKCIPTPYVVVLKVAAPSGAAFNQITATVDGRLSTSLAGATTAARNQIYIGPGRSEIDIAATTPGGQSTAISRTYRSCAKPKPKRKRKQPSSGKPAPIPVGGNPVTTEGGGED